MRNATLTELYLGDPLGWVNVTADARQGSADSGGAHTITRRPGDPGTMDLVLASPGGRYSPRNPRSEYYGLLGRNTPVRFGLEELAETFGTASTDGWGNDWTSFGAGGTVSGSDSTVAGGTGRHFVPVSGAYRVAYYDASPFRDCEVRCTVDMLITDVTGGNIEPANVMFRLQDLSTYYMARVEVSASEVVTVSLHHSTAGTIAAGVTVAGLAFTGQPLAVAASCVGDRLAAKVWDPAAGGEPRDWQVTGVDTGLTAAGYVGIRSGVASGNTNTKPLEFRYDNFQVIDRRAHMEVSEWPPRWNTRGTDAWVPVQASGILRRLGQGRQPVLSAMRRTIAGTAPVAYYPAEDGVLAVGAGSAVSGQSPLVVTGPVEFNGNYDVGSFRLGVAALADLAAGGSLSVAFGGAVTAATRSIWTVHTFGAFDVSFSSGDIVLMEWATPGGTFTRWRLVEFQSTTHTQVIAYNASGTPTVVVDQPGVQGGYRTWAVSAEQVGGNINVSYWLDSNTSVVTGSVAGTLAGVSSMTVNQSRTTSTEPMPFGHLAVWATNHIPYEVGYTLDAYGELIYPPVLSYVGETAADRVERLCAEQGVPVLVSRGERPSTRMGPQGAGAFLDLLRECEDADGGILGEAREQLALTFRCLGAIYNQTPVELDYTHLAPPLEPVDDDDSVRNDITVKRTEGSSARAVREDGSLSVQQPPDGVGVYDTSVTLNVASDELLPDQAGWRLHLGTWDEARYPTARVNLAAPVWAADPDLAALVVALADGDVVALDGLPAWLPPGPALSMVRGTVERVDEFTRTVDWTWTPGGPYAVATADGVQRAGADGSTLATPLTISGISLSLASTTANGLWTTVAADFPLDVRVGGERITLSAISGASSPQTATVSARGVNGVQRAWPAGTDVDVWQPAIAPL